MKGIRYEKGGCVITVERIDGFGKNPGLWIGTDNSLTKVASFGNEDKAQTFIKWLNYFLGADEPPTGN